MKRLVKRLLRLSAVSLSLILFLLLVYVMLYLPVVDKITNPCKYYSQALSDCEVR